MFWRLPQSDNTTVPIRDCHPHQTPIARTRSSEFRNTLAGYKNFGKVCNVSSLDLHQPFEPVCSTRDTVLRAMSSGGRIGRDAPYNARGCDMRWFSTTEACEILGRFSQVILVGDSMLRHVIGALNIIMREDIGYGGVTNWNFNTHERRETIPMRYAANVILTTRNRYRCFCNDQFDVTECSVQGIFKTADVLENDPGSLACPRLIPGWSTDVRMEQMVRYPIEDAERDRLSSAINTTDAKPKAFVLGHGLWNNLEIAQSKAWLSLVINVIESKLKLRDQCASEHKNMPILLITPNAAGDKKSDQFLVTQGNKALVKFEHAMAREAARRSIDHLGTWNMSIQARLYDGVHMDMRGNLMKAMMVLNWLNLLEERVDTGTFWGADTVTHGLLL
ncbi:hypothetical protein GGR57DRAFT_492251 [Xylariaceae sp. FL1272]|nr:hypothetical protein GGR57DRAFT_492251 [Xylariaceae sp. FL1272]